MNSKKIGEEDLLYTPPLPTICSLCHYSLLPEYYFCPNCGTKVIILSTSVFAQIKLYTLSISLPLIAFLAIGSWYGLRYARSDDTKTKVIGTVACLLLALSTFLSIWYTVVIIRETILSATTSIDTLMKGY